ncbi:MAG: response regulator transcription factor [Acidobacteria bacterium]|nr:response regulator transcription factor [Acidobacteriota bacterium]MBU4255084.1 response regulator transcription factor [Acidobacteriota bacterium]MBU4496136.1 response regulator transcription factor [Acidobacteriota bacterium]MCG2817243.1 response regulator transcription factor [Candidatus Aminicenantes bacterium]
MRILIVEDDRKVGGFLQRGLREEQYAVDLCRDGEEAVHRAQVESYDAIILDIMLPGKDGFEICRELREKKVLTPILMLTAKDSLEDKVSGLGEGADDYLTKPFSFEELLARIRALMRRDKDYKTGVLKAADLQLDPTGRTVSRGGRSIELTGREYALLEYLMRNQGRIVTQTQILDHVWDRDYEGTSNIVNVYLNRLRKKIDKGFNPRLFKTVRGIGFTIDANRK